MRSSAPFYLSLAALAVCGVLAVGLVVIALVGTPQGQQSDAALTALCGLMRPLSAQAELAIENPPPGDTPAKAKARQNTLDYERDFLRTC